jgi:Glucodextranase, domain B
MKRAAQLILIFAIVLMLGSCLSPSEIGGQLTTTAPTFTPPANSHLEPLTLEITSPVNGTVTNNNQQLVEGNVTDPKAEVTINGTPAEVSSDGSFIGYVDLPRGKSTVEVVAARGDDSAQASIEATFNPPLALFLDSPATPQGIDYRITPVTFTGFVNYPEASVTVDDTPVKVADNGTFSIQLMLHVWGPTGGKGTSAKATLGEQTDTDGWGIGVSPETGNAGFAPGQGLNRMANIDFEQRSIQMEAGTTAVIPGTFRMLKSVKVPIPAAYDIYRIELKETQSTTQTASPMPDGFKVRLEPANSTLYPNATYKFSLVFETESTLKPGQYLINLLWLTPGNSYISFLLTVI